MYTFLLQIDQTQWESCIYLKIWITLVQIVFHQKNWRICVFKLSSKVKINYSMYVPGFILFTPQNALNVIYSNANHLLYLFSCLLMFVFLFSEFFIILMIFCLFSYHAFYIRIQGISFEIYAKLLTSSNIAKLSLYKQKIRRTNGNMCS